MKENQKSSKGRLKTLPLVMFILSILYMIYVVSNGNVKMVGDEIGGDPGGMILPLSMAIFMVIGFGYLTLTDRAVDKREVDKAERSVLIITFIYAILYVVLQPYLGFVVTSSVLVYGLTNLYLGIGKSKDERSGKITALAFILMEIATIAVYTSFRTLTRKLLYLGRRGAIPSIFGNNNTTAVISLILVLLVIIALVLTVGRRSKEKRWRREYTSAIIAFASTLILYIVFKQFFMVSLIPGIIVW